MTNNNNTRPLFEWIKNYERDIKLCNEQINIGIIKEYNPSFIICYNYRYIVNKDVIAYMDGNIINLHISLLPWNRGSDPNFWGFIDNTPKGVTIHRIDENIDSGSILLQQSVAFDEKKETLETSYNKLQFYIQRLFIENWEQLKAGDIKEYRINEEGSYHRASEFKHVKKMLKNFSWDMKISDLKKEYDAIFPL